MRRFLLALLLASSTTAHAVPRCVEGPPPAPPRKVNANNGLPALGAMVLAGGGALGLFAGFAAAAGTLGAVGSARRPRDAALPLAGTAAVTTLLLGASALAVLVGATTWMVAWLPPITDTRVRCPPRDEDDAVP